MSAMASHIISLTVVYSTVCSGANQRKHQSSTLLAFVWGIHRSPVNSPHRGPVTWKIFPFDDVIMSSSDECIGLWNYAEMLAIDSRMNTKLAKIKLTRCQYKSGISNVYSGKCVWYDPLQWHHNERHGISYRQPHNCLLHCLFRHRSKKMSKLHVTGLCAGNSPVTSEFPTRRASNTENISIWWCHHEFFRCMHRIMELRWNASHW